jgi:isoquinoline 1-oxidoreductase
LPSKAERLSTFAERFLENSNRGKIMEAIAKNQITRRQFIELGAGLLISISAVDAFGQAGESGVVPGAGRGRGGARGGIGGPGARTISARLHIGADNTITVMTGKVECGQGARATIAQAAAEELSADPDSIHLIMADTELSPDDGPTYGSATAPRTIPQVRNGAAAARDILIGLACKKWGVPAAEVRTEFGKIVHPTTLREATFGELVGADSDKTFAGAVPQGVQVSAVANWKILGTSYFRPDRADLVTGAHHYPSDMIGRETLFGKVLRPPSYNAKLRDIDLTAARKLPGVKAVTRLGDFVGVAADTTHQARAAIDVLAKSAVWDETPQISSKQLFDSLKENARNIPINPYADDLKNAAKKLSQTYHVAYVQHCPMEPRTAVAEWKGPQLTVWTGTQNPWGVKQELQTAFSLGPPAVHVIVPDFGGGFGGKHKGDVSIEAARIAKAAGKPVWLRYTREEEFSWAYFRPSALIQAEAGIDDAGKLASWFYLNINSGNAAVNTPYAVEKNQSQFVPSHGPLSEGSYRGLAATANNFGRECFMDELAELSGLDPLSFRLANITDERLKAVLERAAEKFDFANRWKKKDANIGVGIACGTEKGSYLATCVEIAIDRAAGEIKVRKVCQAYECGKILNPGGLMQQVQGAIVMGLGPALREQIEFENGRITNGNFSDYKVPRFADVPEMDIQLIDRPDLDPAGAGETPIMGIAPAIANAVFHATGIRMREMPIKLAKT